MLNVRLKKLEEWIHNNKLELILLLAILLIASFVRLYHIDQYLPFLGDEGRDVRVVRRFLTNFDLMFLGPRTSIGDMYLGPMYYYLIAPFLFLWNYSPAGPAVFVALLSVATVFLIWKVTREWFGKTAAVVASLLYALSPTIIEHSQHSWNPNIMPFFALLAIYSIWRVWQYKQSLSTNKQFKWLLVLGFCFGAILQSHYLGLLLVPTIGIIWLITLRNLKTKERKNFLLYSLFSIFLFSFLMSPIVLFDYKHGWHNIASIYRFFTNRQETVSARPWNSIPELWPLWRDQVITRLVSARDVFWGKWVAIVVALLGLIAGHRFYKQKGVSLNAIRLLGLWLAVGFVGLGLYKQHIYDHYFGFLFPAPFLLLGAIAQSLWKKYKVLVVVLVIVLIWIDIKNSPLQFTPQQQMQRTEEVTQNMIDKSNSKPFNFGLIAKQNYEEAYLYFLELHKSGVREIDPQRTNETITDQLFVVCEDAVCEPINNAKAEIANFGWAKIEEQWQVRGIKIFKLVHTK